MISTRPVKPTRPRETAMCTPIPIKNNNTIMPIMAIATELISYISSPLLSVIFIYDIINISS
jgi:hypothetical protein